MQNMGLPPGALDLARQLEEAVAKLKEVEAITRRMCADFGLNFSDPSRGLDARTTPAVTNPVQLKLPSLQDLDIRDAQDGDLLTFDGTRGKWVARRHDTVQLPKEFPQGDPDSYYTEPAEPVEERVWSPQYVGKNYLTNPSFELSDLSNWTWISPANGYSSATVLDVSYEISATLAYQGSTSMHVSVTWLDPEGLGSGFGGNLFALTPPLPHEARYFGANMRAVGTHSAIASMTTYLMVLDADGQYVTARGAEGPASEGYSPYVYANSTLDTWKYRGTHPSHVSPSGLSVPEGGSLHGVVALDNLPPHTERQIHIDCVIASNGLPPTKDLAFNGDTPDDNAIVYSWDGVPHASTSTALQLRRIQVPAVVKAGEEFTVNGEGFMPGENLWLYMESWEWVPEHVPTDADGKFEIQVTIPEDPEYDPTDENTVRFYTNSPLTTQRCEIIVPFEQ